ncbi:uncharacterized protein LOC105224298 [Bactrocera dorsalis]|uniref:Uncharacterized protein LOC105224298 n=1 Tax=Bactrocera dorsalis TaxID=27457 RepID=A0A6I9VCD3_BACDO|nr:uncharacterized protein LOC105224298 [Bactrocera dorsalis]
MLLKQVFCLIPLLVSFPHSTPGFGMRLMEISDSDHSQVVCALALLQKYFQYGEPLSGSVISMSFTSASLHIQQDLLNAMHTQVVIPWTVVVRNPRQAPNYPRSTMILHEKPQCYFIIIENLEDGDLEDVFEDWKTNINWNPLAQFVVYLASVEETDDEMNELMIEILLSFMNKKIYNVNVIGRNEENGFYYGKTVFPYHPDNNCGNRVIAIETLDMCDYQDPNKPKDKYNFDEEGDGDEVDYDGADDDGGLEYDDINKNNKDGEFDNEHGAKDGEGNHNDNRDADRAEDVVRDKDEGKNTYGNGNSDREGDENPDQDADHRVADGAKMDEYNDGENGVDQDGNEILEEENDSKRSVEGYIKLNRHLKVITESNKRGELNWNFRDFRHERKSNFKTTIETRTKKTFYTREKPQKRSPAKHLKLTDYSQEDRNDSQMQKIYLQELYRASFLDKFPKDLSGCPVVAAFRPWEPYIFKETSEYENRADSNPRADKNNEVLDTNEAAYNLENEENIVNNSYVDDDDDAEAESSYDDVDAADVSDEPAFKLNGIEYQLVQTIGERLHITIDFQLENSNLYHLFQQLIDGDIELILGGIDEDPSISQFVSSSIPYHQDDLTWCVARAKRKYDLFNFLQSFHISTWLFTFVFIMISSLNIYIAQKLLKIRPTYFGDFFATVVRMFGIILSQSTQLTRLPASLHITFGSTFFLAIMFVNVYQSFLVSTLTTPKSSYQISHLEEIYRNRMTVTGSVENVRHLNKDGKIFKYIREKFQMCYNIEECLNRAATDESFAVAVSRQHSFYNPHIKRDQLYCFDRNENIYVYLVTMLLPKKFHLLPKINPVIQHIIESGHMQKWARELDLKRRIREEIQRAQKVLVKSLTINQIVGSFALHGMLSAVALVIFILEYWTHWMVVKRRTRLRLLKFLHRKFSSR